MHSTDLLTKRTSHPPPHLCQEVLLCVRAFRLPSVLNRSSSGRRFVPSLWSIRCVRQQVTSPCLETVVRTAQSPGNENSELGGFSAGLI